MDVNSSLISAVCEGRLERVRELIYSYGLSYSKAWSEGYVLLCYAVWKKHSAVAKLLLESGCKVNSKSEKHSDTPLHSAFINCDIEIVQMILDRGGDINAKNEWGITPLHNAIKYNDMEVIELLLKHGADVNARDNDGTSLLHVAAGINGDIEIVKMILDKGANVNAKNQYGRTPLYKSIESKKMEVMELLLKHGADVNARDNDGTSLLHVAAGINGDIEIVKMILEKGANVNAKNQYGRTPLYKSIENNKMEVIELLLKHGADVNARDNDGTSLLHVAAEIGCLQTVEHLLKYGAYVNCVCTSKWRKSYVPLHFAVEKGDQEVVTLLLNRGANVDVKGEDGITPLHIAAQNGYIHIAEDLLNHGACTHSFTLKEGYTPLHFTSLIEGHDFGFRTNEDINIKGEIAKLLLSKGANVDAQTKNGVTTLHAAVQEGYAKVVEALLKCNANVNSADKNDITPLHLSAQRGNVEICTMLLNKGANVNAKQHDGFTALHIATQYGHKEVVKVLLECGAKVDSKTKSDITPLHLSAEEGYQEIIETILKFGANIDSRDEYGRTALHIASEEGHDEVVVTLLEYGSDINITSRNNHTPLDYAIAGISRQINSYSYSSDDDDYYDPDRGICTCEVIAIILKKQIVKVEAAGLYVSERNLLLLGSDDGIRDYNEISHFQNECEAEVEIMKGEKIVNSNASFHDILTKSISRLAIYAGNENIVHAFKSNDYKIKFSIYASMIDRQFRRGIERKELLEQGNNSFNSLFESAPELPYQCTEKIFSYLSDEDLRILMGACKPLSITYPNTNINDVVITSSISQVQYVSVKKE